MKIIDGHQDIAFNTLHVTGKNFFVRNNFDESHLLTAPQLNQSDYVRLVDSGVKVVFGVCFPYRFRSGKPFANIESASIEMFRQLDYYNQLEILSGGKVKIVRTVTDLEFVLCTDGVLGIVILIEDALGVSLKNIENLYIHGVRIIGPVWNRDNQYGGGTDTDNGITKQGKKLFRKMEELGIVLDTAHMNSTFFWDSMTFFKGKVINSHTCNFSLNSHRRNLNDEQLREIARRNGVVGITFVPAFLNSKVTDTHLSDVVAHIEYAVKICGIDHVALGSDFDGMSWPQFVPRLKDASEYGNLVHELQSVFTIMDLEKIAYKNWVNFLKS